MSSHPTAIVDPQSKIHPSCKIGPYCVIGPQVELGEGCHLVSHVVIEAAQHLFAAVELRHLRAQAAED